MALRFRKSIKICKGVRVNLNKDSTSVTLGNGIRKTTINNKGRVSKSTKIPGTSMYYTETVKSGNKRRPATDQKTYSPKLYKASGTIILILAILAIPFNLLLTILFPIVGIIFLIFGIALFPLSAKHFKMAKQIAEEETDSDNE